MTAGAEGGKVRIRIKRQERANQPPRWEEYSVSGRASLTILGCLQWIGAHPVLADGAATSPPAWEGQCLEGVCGGCTMLINGKAKPACLALVESLAETETAITLEPLSKFPVVRDLVVDRSRYFEDLKRAAAWTPIDGSFDVGPGPGVRRREQERRYPLSRCTHCACCLEACPTYTKEGKFVGAAVINQARVLNEHPTGATLKPARLDALMEEGGIQDCGKSGNCVEVCPQRIPLLESIAIVQRQANVHAIKSFFGG